MTTAGPDSGRRDVATVVGRPSTSTPPSGMRTDDEGSTTTELDLIGHAQALVTENRYLTLGTTSADGRPWTSPVCFAAAGVQEFYWVSRSDARHSANIRGHRDVSLVVFDSTVEPYHGRALYVTGHAFELSADDLDAGLAVYPGPNRPGVSCLTHDDVTGAAAYRLYRATATDAWVLCPRDPMQPCPLHGIAHDHRVRIVGSSAGSGSGSGSGSGEDR